MQYKVVEDVNEGEVLRLPLKAFKFQIWLRLEKSGSVKIGHGGGVVAAGCRCLCLDCLQKFKFQIPNPQIPNQILIPAETSIFPHKLPFLNCY